MALQFVLASIDDLPDDVKKLYKKREDGKFQLDTDDVVDKSKLDEFRTNNRELKAANEDLLRKFQAFEGVDPAKYKALLDKFQSDEEKKLMKDGNIEEVVKLRTAAIVKDRDDQLAAKDKLIAKLQEDTKKATSEKDTYIVETELRKAVDNPELGFQPNVANILKDSVLKEFVHKDGKVIRVKPDGSSVFGKSGDPMGLEEFVTGFAKEHPYLVKPSNGGGAHNEHKPNANGKTMKRGDFDRLDPTAKHSFVTVDKGVVVDA
jgi:hypothetical protein